MLTIEPLPRSTIDGSAARQVWNAAVRSVAMTASHSSGSISRNGPTWVRPALLTRPSTRPKRSITSRDQPLGLLAVAEVGGEAVALGAGLAHAGQRPLGAVAPTGGSGPRRGALRGRP